MFYEVAPASKVESLTYASDSPLLPGQIVTVPLGRRMVPGVVLKKVVQPNFPTKQISKVLYSKPLPKHLIKAAEFIHQYYLASTGEAFSLILPNGVQKQRRKPKTEQMFGNHMFKLENDSHTLSRGASTLKIENDSYTLSRGASTTPVATGVVALHLALPGSEPPSIGRTNRFTPASKMATIPLNPAQKNALQALQQAPGATKLLHGVTGSGKTNIYLQMALNAFKRQKSSIILVPEIALTSQLVRVFQSIFGEKVIVIHSKQTEAERHLIFNSLLLSEDPKIVIGPRSALFAPLDNLGLIVIDEEHETTYYQDNPPRYSAIRVASFMAKELGIDLILGSATPTIEDYHLAKHRHTLVTLSQKAKPSALTPKINLIDLTNRHDFRKNRYFCDQLLASIEDNLKHNRQTLIFHNRRGSATLTICENCGKEISCPNCFLPLTLHADKYILHCHTCGHSEKVPTNCPECQAPGLVHKGFGTKLLETELTTLFPQASVKRFDADNKKGEDLEAVYEEVKSGKIDILVGTQTLAKGLDLPKLATVGVAQADAGLMLPDYLAEERTYQLLTQVMGRVGRGHLEQANVFIQTYRPEHPVLRFAIQDSYEEFYNYLVKRRSRAGFPPCKFVMKLEITLKTEKLVIKKVREAATQLAKDPRLIVSPPCPAFHERTVRGYSWQIITRSKSRSALVSACQELDKNFRIFLDPPGLL